jgi:hypothetical protein
MPKLKFVLVLVSGNLMSDLNRSANKIIPARLTACPARKLNSSRTRRRTRTISNFGVQAKPPSTQPIRRSATAALCLDQCFGRTPSQRLPSSVCRADPAVRGESAQRSKVRAGAVESLPCRLPRSKEAPRQSAARKLLRGRPNQSFRLEIRSTLAQSRLGAPDRDFHSK